MLTLSLEKPGTEAPKKLQLSLNKGARFTVKINWECAADHEDDVDIHALEASNAGEGAKVTALESVLSTYNTRKMNPRGGVLQNNADGSFSTPSGGLIHSGDIRRQGNFETITIDGSHIPEGVNEIPLLRRFTRPNMGMSTKRKTTSPTRKRHLPISRSALSPFPAMMAENLGPTSFRMSLVSSMWFSSAASCWLTTDGSMHPWAVASPERSTMSLRISPKNGHA